MGNPAGSDELASRIAAIRGQFFQSLRRIEFYFHASEGGFKKAEEVWSSILSKFEQAERGEPWDPKDYGPDAISLELPRDQVEVLREMASEVLGATDHYPGMLAEMGLISLFANYDAFISDLLAETYRARPTLLKSGKKITAEVVLGASSMEELVEELIAREVQDWRLSFREQMSSLDDRFGVNVCAHEEEIATVAEAHERRHVLVHRGGAVDNRYLNAVPASGLLKGARVSVDLDYWRAVAAALSTVVNAIADEVPSRCLRVEEKSDGALDAN